MSEKEKKLNDSRVHIDSTIPAHMVEDLMNDGIKAVLENATDTSNELAGTKEKVQVVEVSGSGQKKLTEGMPYETGEIKIEEVSPPSD